MNAQVSTTMTASTRARQRSWGESLALYLELSKARLSALVVVTAVAGYVVAARGRSDIWTLLTLALGTTLTAFGAAIFNQIAETGPDALMRRTRNRPLPSGRITRSEALLWGVLSAAVGTAILAAGSNLLTAALAVSVIVLYVAVYTPLKRHSSLNTVIGAVCGAIPPMMGWTAATARIEAGAWILFGILFIWQIPHFLALAWLYRSDYQRGGFKMLPDQDPEGRFLGRVVLVYTAGLLPLSALATLEGLSGISFLLGSQLLGLGFLWLAWRFKVEQSTRSARRLFLASVIYLPLVLGLMVGDMDDRLRLRTGLDIPQHQSPAAAAAAAPADTRAPG